MSHLDSRFSLERDEEWRSFCGDGMPWLSFPDEWEVQLIPPFGGALVRFKVRRDDSPKDQVVSVYFDAHSRLGLMPYPYWEVYPCPSDHMSDGDECRRFRQEEIDELMDAVEDALDHIAST